MLSDVQSRLLEPSSSPLDPALRESPELGSAFAATLSRPLPIQEVERIERLAVRLWRDVASGEDASAADRLAFSRFFRQLGFLYKYKSYGVKIASPFGYSLFRLHPGEGFSFQVHTEPKLEAFHILAPSEQAFVYLSSVAQWRQSGAEAARRWAQADAHFDSPFAVAPRPGDVFCVRETNVVHSVVGCVLEEFASCSVDAVERLLDQNEGRAVELPARHPDLSTLLAETATVGRPVRRLSPQSGGWAPVALDGDDPIISVPGQLTGRRWVLDAGQTRTVRADEGFVTAIAVLRGSGSAVLEGWTTPLGAGELVALPPGGRAEVAAAEHGAVLAVHTVASELLLRDWGG